MADIDFQNGFINGFVVGSTNIEVDMVNKRDSEANWQSINPIVANGEQVIVDTPDGVKIKIGDGVSHFNELEYTDKVIIDALDQKADKSELSNVNAAQLNGKTATDIENTSKAYADAAAKSVKDDLTNHSTEAYETLKQLGELIDDNKDALDALNTVATGKADLIHSHEIPDVNELPERLEGIEKELKEKADSTEILPIVQDSIRAEAGPNIGTVGTPSVSSRIDGDDVVFTFDYLKGAKGNDGGKGDKGDPGVSATHSWDGTTLSVTSASGTSSADLKGEKGDPGTSATHSWDGTTLSITSASGTTSANLKGEKGDNGVGVSKIEQTTTSNVDGGENIITATLSNNQKSTFTIKNGSGGSAGARGSLWFSGTGITGTSTTADIFTNSGVTSANANDYFLNISTGNVYKCTTGGNMQAAKWVYVGSVKGATGASISSATDLYYAKSNTTAPSAPTATVTTNSAGTYNVWNKALPTYSASYPYYFTCVEILYDDGTRKWSTPVYAAAITSANQIAAAASSNVNTANTTANTANTNATNALNAINNLQVGGRNYFLASDKFTTTGSGDTGITPSIVDGVLKVVLATTHGNWHGFYRSNIIETNFKTGDKFTFSIEIKADSGSSGKPSIYFKSGMGYYDLIGTVGTEYSTLYYTGTWIDTNDISLHFGWSGAKGTFYIRKIKFERGTKPTDWCPAIEDMAGRSGTGNCAEIFNDYRPRVMIGDSIYASEGNTAEGYYAHAEGGATTASGSASHAEGSSTIASGSLGSHSEGHMSIASGQSSHAEGWGTIASGENQHAQGKYNKEDTDNKYAHIVGNGTANPASSRSNAHTLDWNGKAWFASDVCIGGTDQDSATTSLSAVKTTANTASSNASTALSTANTAKSTADSALSRVTIKDTRSTNQNPSWYISNYPFQVVEEFKYASTIGLSGETYCYLETIVPWNDASGGYPKQAAYINDKIYNRVGTSNTAWGSWTTSSNIMTGATASAAGAKGLVPAPSAGQQRRYLRGDGTWETPANNSVSQYNTTTNADYPILTTYYANQTANYTDWTRYSAGVTLNPSTNTIKGANLDGAAKTLTGLTTPIESLNRTDFSNWHSESVTTLSLPVNSGMGRIIDGGYREFPFKIGLVVGQTYTLTATDDDGESSSESFVCESCTLLKDANGNALSLPSIVLASTSSSKIYAIIDGVEILFPDGSVARKGNGCVIYGLYTDNENLEEFTITGSGLKEDYWRWPQLPADIFGNASGLYGLEYNGIELQDILDNAIGQEDPDGYGEIFNDYISNIAYGSYSHAEGYNNKVYGNYSHVEGYYNSIGSSSSDTTVAYYSHAEGSSNTVSSGYSHAEGSSNTVSGSYSHAEGYYNTVSGPYSHAEGYSNQASAQYTHAEGYSTIANKTAAHAEGYDTNATGLYSHAEGYQTTASGEEAHAEGKTTTAGGNYSHAEGINSKSSAYGSHAQNTGTTASGGNSHAEGYYTTASGAESHAEGQSTIAGSAAQHVQGKFNVQDTASKYCDIIGNGTSSARANIATMDWNGVNWCKGGLGMGGTSMTACSGLVPIDASTTTTTAMGTKYAHTSNINDSGTASVTDYGNNVANTQVVTITGSTELEVTITYQTESTTYDWVCIFDGAHSDYTAQTTGYRAKLGGTTKTTSVYTIPGDSVTFAFRSDGSQCAYYGYYAVVKGKKVTTSTKVNVGFVAGDLSTTNTAKIYADTVQGYMYAKSHATSSADYAEYYEWADGNPNNEDRRGHFVTFAEGNKIRIANDQDDYILGVVSVSPAVVGNDYDAEWCGKYLTDAFGKVLTEEVFVEEQVNEETGETIPAHIEIIPILNPDYDDTQEYISREKRKEWVPIGTHGQLILIDNGLCEVGKYCMPGEDGTAVPSDQKNYRIIERLDDSHIKIVIK